MNLTFNIPEILIDKVDILLDRIPYLSETITGMSYNNTEKVINLTVNEEDPKSTKLVELKKSFRDLCNSFENTRSIRERVMKSNLGSDEFTALQPRENNTSHSSYMCELDVLLMEKLDKEFTGIAKKHGAELREYPSVLSKKNMTRNQYHIHYPQNIYGVTSVPHDYKTINAFRIKAQQECYDDFFVFQGEILQPCICYHCYEELQEKRLSDVKMLTGKGKCYRHEVEWKKDNFRLSEFTMREIVYIGKKEWVVHARNRIMEDVWSLFESLGLQGRIATATDPFFFSQDLKTKGTYQMMSNAKYELIVRTMSGREVSIASFNYCLDILCSKYEIKDHHDEALYSGCVAFGIDRWKEALIDIHGSDMRKWPEMNIGREMLL